MLDYQIDLERQISTLDSKFTLDFSLIMLITRILKIDLETLYSLIRVEIFRVLPCKKVDVWSIMLSLEAF